MATILFGKNFIFTDRKDSTPNTNIILKGQNLTLKNVKEVTGAPSAYFGYSNELSTYLEVSPPTKFEFPTVAYQVNFTQSQDRKTITYVGGIEKYFRFSLITTIISSDTTGGNKFRTLIYKNGSQLHLQVNEFSSIGVYRQMKFYTLVKLKNGDQLELYHDASGSGLRYEMTMASHQLAITPI